MSGSKPKTIGCSVYGCSGKHIAKGFCTKHYAQFNQRTRTAWKDMMRRCYSVTFKSYKDYGGRGITVCDKWKIYENFYQDMGEIPVRMSLERIDNSKGYSPENCKWATYKEQKRNTRQTRKIPYNGKILCVVDVAREIGMKPNTLEKRLLAGWTVERAITEQVRKVSIE